ncbi:MAG: hypothetical protein JWQ97_3044 [Phenylobacterium sp.]|nr:hypothetical protein [Phenylobacterium sp.]
MEARLDATVAAIRAELARQAAEGNATYNGVSTDGRDAVEGYFDLVSVARAVLTALGDPDARARRAGGASAADQRALSTEADERQTMRQAPDDASPGESGQGASVG